MNLETLKIETARTLLTLAVLSPALIAFSYWLVTGRSILSLFGW